MVWVVFLRDFDFDPDAFAGRVTIAYKAGTEENITRECLAKAKAASAAQTIRPKKRVPKNGG